MSIRSFLASCLLVSPLLATQTAADMGQIHVSLEGTTVSESAQKAIILHNNSEEVLILGTELRASRNTPVVRFIPFPSQPQVSLAPKGVFERLAELVAKYKLQFAYTFQSKGGPAETRHSGVEVHLSTRLGAHDLVVIRVRNTAAFRAWVDAYFRRKGLHGAIHYKQAEAIVADYVARGIDWFVIDAVELTADTRFVDPVAYRFRSTSLYYPLKTSNTFGGKGDIELFIAAPTTLCAPGSNFLDQELDKAVDADGRVTGPCLNLRVKASTSVLLVPEERDIDKIFAGAGPFFGGKPVFLQAIRYSGDYRFDNDVMLPMPAGAAKALNAPEPEEWNTPWNALMLPEERAQCRKVPDKGPCKALFERFYFDPASKSCKAFFWGGCQGEVPFETRENCEKTCTLPVKH
jgi:hypothetical protein